MRSWSLLTLSLLFVLGSAACGNRNAYEFNDYTGQGRAPSAADLTLTKREVSDQGSGDAGAGSYAVRRITLGGSYGRQVGLGSTNFTFSAGVHGNPRATQ
jgi:hypothetical protein